MDQNVRIRHMNAVMPPRLLQARAAPALAAGLVLAGLLLAWSGRAAASGPGTPAEATPPMDLPKPATRIYKSLSGGTTSFSDRPPSHGAYVVLRPQCFACNPASTVDWHVTRLYRDAFAEEINVAARQYKVDPALVRAVIHAESGFNVHARSPKGAVGLMQLMPATAKVLGVANPRVPRENIHGGAKYLADLLAQFKNDVMLATAAYNAGPQAVQKYAGVPPYAETQVYVQRVRILHQRYKSGPQS
jgi:soluble lytic murein transglycosylase-like protein